MMVRRLIDTRCFYPDLPSDPIEYCHECFWGRKQVWDVIKRRYPPPSQDGYKRYTFGIDQLLNSLRNRRDTYPFTFESPPTPPDSPQHVLPEVFTPEESSLDRARRKPFFKELTIYKTALEIGVTPIPTPPPPGNLQPPRTHLPMSPLEPPLLRRAPTIELGGSLDLRKTVLILTGVLHQLMDGSTAMEHVLLSAYAVETQMTPVKPSYSMAPPRRDDEIQQSTLVGAGAIKIFILLQSQSQKEEIMKLKNENILKDNEIKKLKESLHAIEMKALEMTYHHKSLKQAIEKLCDVLVEKADPNKSTENREAVYKIAVLKSAKALLQLDEDYSTQRRTNGNGGAFNEMSQQVSVYLTEVARIHELLTIKNQQRDVLLKEYLDENAQLSRISVSRSREGHSGASPTWGYNVDTRQLVPNFDFGPSGVNLLPTSNMGSSGSSSSETSVHHRSGNRASGSCSESVRSSRSKAKHTSPRDPMPQSSSSSSSEASVHVHYSRSRTKQTDATQGTGHHPNPEPSAPSRNEPQTEEEEAEMNTTSYLMTRCAQLEDLLAKEQRENVLSRNEVETLKQNLATVQEQLSTKSNLSKLLNSLIELLRSKGCTEKTVIEKLRSDIKWLMSENQKLFEKSVQTQSKLCKHKEENARIRIDLDNLRRDSANELYVAKMNHELRHLQERILDSAANMVQDS